MFRITPLSTAQSALYQNQNHIGRLARLQNQASSGLKYSRPSDNPLATRSIGILKRNLNELKTQNERIEDIKHPLNSSVTNLLDANNLVTRARQIALEAPQAYSENERKALASEVDSMIDRMMSIANSKHRDHYMYSGNSPDVRPFEMVTGTGQAIPSVQYNGSSQDAVAVISDSISIRSRVSGADVFQHRVRGETLVLGNTGAHSGTGMDSEIGRVNLRVRHTATTYAAGSGVTPGTDSPDGDTVIGQAGEHVLNIRDTSGTGTSGFVSLNGAAEVPWTAANNSLRVTGRESEVVFIDTSAITAGFNGDVAMTGDGTLSTDGGATEIAIDFSANQVIQNQITGGVANVDSSAIRLAGIDSMEFQGTSDAVTVLLELKNDLLNTRDLPDNQQYEAFGRRLADLDRIGDHLLETVGVQSVALKELDQLKSVTENHQLELSTTLADVESADLAKVIVEMQNIQTTMQFNYASLSILQNNNLLEFLG